MTHTSSGAAELEAELEIEVLMSATKKYCSSQDTSSSSLKHDHKLKTGSILTENVKLILSDPQYSTHSACGQSSFGQDVFWKRDTENAASLVGSVVALGMHGHILCSDSVIYRLNKSSRCVKGEGGRLCRRELEMRAKKVWETFEVERNELVHIKCPWPKSVNFGKKSVLRPRFW